MTLSPRFCNRFAALSLLASVLLAASGVASAQTVTQVNNWDESGFTQKWVSEGRIGDRGGAGTFESDLGATTSAPSAQAQLGWISGQDYNFTLSYQNGTATWNIAGQSVSPLTYAVPTAAQNVSDLFIRVYARNAGTTMSISNLALNGSALAGAVSQTGAAVPPINGNALRIASNTLPSGFTLTGTARMTWSGTAPTNSSLAFQVKAGNQAATAIPEPGTVALLAATVLPVIGIARRRKK